MVADGSLLLCTLIALSAPKAVCSIRPSALRAELLSETEALARIE